MKKYFSRCRACMLMVLVTCLFLSNSVGVFASESIAVETAEEDAENNFDSVEIFSEEVEMPRLEATGGTSMEQATVIYPDTEYQDTIIKQGEKYFYKFSIVETSLVTFHVKALATYMDIYLYDESGNNIWATSASANSAGYSTSNQADYLDAGTYVFLYFGKYYGSVGHYSFSYDIKTAEAYYPNSMDIKGNSVSSSGTKISLNTGYRDCLTDQRAKNWYILQTNTDVFFHFDGLNEWLIVQLYKSDDMGTTLFNKSSYRDSNSGHNVINAEWILTAGTYYIGISKYSDWSAHNGFYEFYVSTEGDPSVNFGWRTINGKKYWYENGTRQGTVRDPNGVPDVLYGGSIRGREIYDPESDGWYWLDAIYDGAKAESKEVWMPYVYQEDLVKGINPEGKWVRYDANGKMIKGWYTVRGSDASIYPAQSGNTYYYHPQTGEMVKGRWYIDGKWYYFDINTGVLR